MLLPLLATPLHLALPAAKERQRRSSLHRSSPRRSASAALLAAPPPLPLALAAPKACFGHTEGAAGLTGALAAASGAASPDLDGLASRLRELVAGDFARAAADARAALDALVDAGLIGAALFIGLKTAGILQV